MTIDHAHKTEWISAKSEPKHMGFYETLHSSGCIESAEFFEGNWSPSSEHFTHWRGQLTYLSVTEKKRLWLVLKDFQNHRGSPIAREAAGEAAIRLARHMAGPTRKRESLRQKACELFMIGAALGASLEDADIAYQTSRWRQITEERRKKIDAKVTKFAGLMAKF